MTDSANEMTPQEKIIQERVAQARKFLTSNGFNQSIKNLWNKKASEDDKKFLSEQEAIETSESQVNQ